VVRDHGSALPEEVLSDVMLCVTELVTNSVQHPHVPGNGDVEMWLRMSDEGVRVRVGDRGPGFEPKRHPPRGEKGGYGLHIVELLADRWGVERGDLTWVWFEIDLGGYGASK
jgi:anti-sigma regulatory factor (Ser/Thr protein kinase)